MKGRLRNLFASVALVSAFRASAAWACATCSCGDPTLTAMGAEKPFAGRLRLSVDARHRTDHIGEPGVDRVDLSEWRTDAQAAWALTSDLFVMATVPYLQRTIGYVNEAETTSSGIGDIELRAKLFVYRDRAFSPRHLIAVVPGIKLPTAGTVRSQGGERLPLEAQPGTGSYDPMVGLNYGFFAHPWSFYASASGAAPAKAKSDFRASPSLKTTVRLQRQLDTIFAIRVGTDTRLDGKAYEDGKAERDSGGFIGFTSAEVIVSATTDLLLVLSGSAPVVQQLNGHHREGRVIGVSLVYDW